ncbi:hypothetical protein N0V90_011907 [Kalmusia sp. IMI 367209]|nr:hypothetical protein N0V90_011907 [Kalmusia sp. IMI 367209]
MLWILTSFFVVCVNSAKPNSELLSVQEIPASLIEKCGRPQLPFFSPDPDEEYTQLECGDEIYGLEYFRIEPHMRNDAIDSFCWWLYNEKKSVSWTQYASYVVRKPDYIIDVAVRSERWGTNISYKSWQDVETCRRGFHCELTDPCLASPGSGRGFLRKMRRDCKDDNWRRHFSTSGGKYTNDYQRYELRRRNPERGPFEMPPPWSADLQCSWTDKADSERFELIDAQAATMLLCSQLHDEWKHMRPGDKPSPVTVNGVVAKVEILPFGNGTDEEPDSRCSSRETFKTKLDTNHGKTPSGCSSGLSSNLSSPASASGNPNAVDYSTIGWSQSDRFVSHAKHGPAFALVTPFKTNIMVSDMAAAREVLKDWRKWTKNQDLYSMMNAFGKNLNSVNGDDWARHRKVTAPAFKEANSKLVWKATLSQLASVTSNWTASAREGKGKEEISLRRLREDTSRVAMHVLMSAAFGKEYEFDSGVKVVEPGHRMSFGEAMHTCIGSVAIMLVPVTFAAARLPSFLIPGGLKRLQIAVEEVRGFLKDSVETEREALAHVRANEEEKKGDQGRRMALTDDELYGNLFMFNMAGHETTSASLSYAIPLLATYPEIQDWIREEVDVVFAEEGMNNYAEVFPRLARTLALMYETQRFFSAIPMHPKYTGNTAQVLKLNGIATVIPPETFVSVNYNAVHFDPATWGPDVNDFRPSRWIKGAEGAGKELFAVPDGAEFVGWASGPRVCPGKRFSQVEFVAAIARLLIECEIHPIVRAGESNEQAKEHLLATTSNVEHFISLQLRDPDAAGIVCVGRQAS